MQSTISLKISFLSTGHRFALFYNPRLVEPTPTVKLLHNTYEISEILV